MQNLTQYGANFSGPIRPHLRAAGSLSAGVGSLPRSLTFLTTGRSPMKDFFVHFIRDQVGTTAIEYGLIGALISVVCIAGMTLVGGQLTAMYTAVSAAITPALAG